MVLVTLNPVLASLDIKPTDKVISIKENGNIDSNFIITHLMKQALNEDNNVCLVILHNTLGHYQNVGKRLGYDFMKHVEIGSIRTIEPLQDIVEDIGSSTSPSYLDDDKENVVRSLFLKIKHTVDELTSSKNAYLIIDDISHLLDLGIDLNHIITFINYCLNLVNNNRTHVVINTHVSGKSDEIICKNLNYVSDVSIEVLPLKTGQSSEVTGLMVVERAGNTEPARYHYKAYDKGIKTFHLGESLYNLYK